MYKFFLAAPVAALIGLAGCTGDDNPQLSMCQATTKYLVNGVSSWDGTDESNSGNQRRVTIAFTDATGASGEVACVYKTRDNGKLETAPTSVAINGQQVPARDLIAAGAQASKELLEGTAANTVAVSKEFAAEAEVKGRELMDQAGEVAGEAKRRLENAADALAQ